MLLAIEVWPLDEHGRAGRSHVRLLDLATGKESATRINVGEQVATLLLQITEITHLAAG